MIPTFAAAASRKKVSAGRGRNMLKMICTLWTFCVGERCAARASSMVSTGHAMEADLPFTHEGVERAEDLRAPVHLRERAAGGDRSLRPGGFRRRRSTEGPEVGQVVAVRCVGAEPAPGLGRDVDRLPRRSFRSRPTRRSLRPSPARRSAVSMKLMPASTAAWKNADRLVVGRRPRSPRWPTRRTRFPRSTGPSARARGSSCRSGGAAGPATARSFRHALTAAGRPRWWWDRDRRRRR